MRLSRYFLPALAAPPDETEPASYGLMLRAGLVRRGADGIYAWLPLGLRVLDRVCALIRQEQARADAIEMLMPVIQPRELWRESGRDETFGPEMLRLRDRGKREMVLAPTAEEAVTALFRDSAPSASDLPKILYQIAWKFRDDLSSEAGTLHAREFLMKDAYSFDRDPEAARHAYNKMFVAYLRTFDALGLRALPLRAATGPIGGDLSHEFVVLSEGGRSEVFCDAACLDFAIPPPGIDFEDVAGLQGTVDGWTSHYAASDALHDPAVFAEVPEGSRLTARGIEVGHIFYLGTAYSEPMGALVADPDGEERPLHMGCYGIGVTRLVAAIVETHRDAAGIVWPDSVAPFDVALINLRVGSSTADRACDAIQAELDAGGLSVLYDDRDAAPAKKFALADLIGLPWQVIVGPQVADKGRVELRRRAGGEREWLAPVDLLARLRYGG